MTHPWSFWFSRSGNLTSPPPPQGHPDPIGLETTLSDRAKLCTSYPASPWSGRAKLKGPPFSSPKPVHSRLPPPPSFHIPALTSNGNSSSFKASFFNGKFSNSTAPKKYKHHEMFSRQMQEVPTVCKSLKVKGKALHLDPGYKKPWVELPRACVLHLH